MFKSRFKHFILARHYRGYGVHSPLVYNFIREVLVGKNKKQTLDRIVNYFVGQQILIVEPFTLSENELVDCGDRIVVCKKPSCATLPLKQLHSKVVIIIELRDYIIFLPTNSCHFGQYYRVRY